MLTAPAGSPAPHFVAGTPQGAGGRQSNQCGRAARIGQRYHEPLEARGAIAMTVLFALETQWIILIGAGVVLLLFLLWAVGAYNGLVGLRNQFKNAFSQIDVQSKRRYDLIPNLVE